jgi:hypothetical protein
MVGRRMVQGLFAPQCLAAGDGTTHCVRVALRRLVAVEGYWLRSI